MSLTAEESFAAAAHLVLDLVEADKRGESQSDLIVALDDQLDRHDISLVAGKAIALMTRIFASYRDLPGGNAFVDNYLNSLACNVPPRPDWMHDPHPLDLSQL